jgi:hypothetical protein
MNDNTKRLLLIGGSLVVIGGVAYYFLKKRKEAKNYDESEETVIVTPLVESTPVGGGSTTVTQPSSDVPAELNTTDKIKAFQDFMDGLGPWVKGANNKYVLLNKGNGYGNYGPSTKAAFNVYKDLYVVYLRVKPKGRIINTASGLSSPAIDVDLSNGTIARYSNDKKFVQFASNYGSAINTGSWTKGGRKIAIFNGTKSGKVFDNDIIWDTLKQLIAQ